jgi:hypothetical protein
MDCPYSSLSCPRCELSTDPPDAGLAEAEIAAFNGFWQCQTLDTVSRAPTPATFGAPSAGNADFVVIQTHLSLGF